MKSLLTGAFIGTYSHIILDMLLYREMNPLFPLNGNPFYSPDVALPVFITVYATAGVSTIAFLILYAKKYAAENKSNVLQ